MKNIAKLTSYGCYLDCDFETAKYPDDKTHIVGLLAEYVYDLEQRILHYDERYAKLWHEIETLRECVSKESDQEQKISNLEAKLAESEKSEETYKSMFEIGVENNHSLLKEIKQLKQQLTEKEKVSPKSSVKEIVKSQDIKCFFRDKTFAQIQKCGDVYSPQYGYFDFEDDYDELLNNKKDDRFDIVAIEVIKTTK